jgi:hypothetical protein
MDHEEMQTLRAADSTRCGGTATGLSVEGNSPCTSALLKHLTTPGLDVTGRILGGVGE